MFNQQWRKDVFSVGWEFNKRFSPLNLNHIFQDKLGEIGKNVYTASLEQKRKIWNDSIVAIIIAKSNET